MKLTDEQILDLADKYMDSDGEDFYNANHKSLMQFIRALLSSALAAEGGEVRAFTAEQIAALRVAADALIERYAEPIRVILRNAEEVAPQSQVDKDSK